MRRSLAFLVNFSPIYMPALSPSMDSGIIVEWKKKVGDLVKENDVFCTIQTDKAVVDFTNTFDAGYLGKIFRQNGETVAVASTIAAMVEESQDVSKLADYTLKDVEPGKVDEEAVAAPVSTTTATTKTTTPKPAGGKIRYGGSLDEAVAASGPGVMRIAARLDKAALEAITPTGRGGRFTKADFVGQPGFDYEKAAPAPKGSSSSFTNASRECCAENTNGTVGSSAVVKSYPVYNFKVSDTTLLQQLLNSMPTPKAKGAAVGK
ncbi:dihydrolipoamide acetyltransferase, putative [Trypanosoma brucei gambiense DAL972]|uniref:Dihydrolipoamide acetyltransferase, putative n=1 Tax=Trypanosoma brucei gambiense (strain MHOM/CI/86/DAL972) TaxID=679716 RepID=D0A1Q7_TRYB9|nr:dihydrolipoamide acetyltransferase, putative [Trypanosoma brucei gambiense DAL972]CBH15200.1 dihydrolipoamide acetyltransferase, putative [Trypanosoma brucei gambiense DAL972]|eukprot:XP_011777465.1 dihydrolipoamide acetyltransferase, putative [Trypanosoma brucei gambiense DAL972]